MAESKKLQKGNVVLCGANSYEQKYYFNQDFAKLPESIRQELQIMCVLFTEDVGGILTMEFTPEGELEFKVQADEEDYLFDEIGSGLKIKQYQTEKRDFLEGLELFYQVFFLGADPAAFLGETKENEEAPDETDTAEDGKLMPEETGAAEDGKSMPEETGAAEDGNVMPEETGAAEDGKSMPEETGAAEDGNVMPEETGAAEDGKSMPEETGAAEDGNVMPEETGAAEDGNVMPEETGAAEDGKSMPEETGAAEDGKSMPDETDSVVMDEKKAGGQRAAEKERMQGDSTP